MMQKSSQPAVKILNITADNRLPSASFCYLIEFVNMISSGLIHMQGAWLEVEVSLVENASTVLPLLLRSGGEMALVTICAMLVVSTTR